jgi:hypothetical protein
LNHLLERKMRRAIDWVDWSCGRENRRGVMNVCPKDSWGTQRIEKELMSGGGDA